MVTEERVANLETALAQFIEQSNRTIAAIHEHVAEGRASIARTDRLVAAIHEDVAENRASIARTDRLVAAIHEDVAEIRASNARTDRRLLELQEQADKDRQQVEKDRQQVEKDRQRAEKDRKDFNKRMAELSDSMGTLIEDMVAPGGFQLAKAIFGDQEAQTCTIRVRRRHPANPAEMMELDLLAIGTTKVLVVEVKRRIDPGKITEYREKLARLAEFFPELAANAVMAAVASVYLDPSVIAFLNRQKVYGIAMGDDVMEVVNLGRF